MKYMKQDSAIMQMFFGQKGHCDKITCSKEYIEYMGEFVRNEQKLKEQLSQYPDIESLYIRAKSAMENMYQEQANDYYAEGFKFGMLLGMEIIEKK